MLVSQIKNSLSTNMSSLSPDKTAASEKRVLSEQCEDPSGTTQCCLSEIFPGLANRKKLGVKLAPKLRSSPCQLGSLASCFVSFSVWFKPFPFATVNDFLASETSESSARTTTRGFMGLPVMQMRQCDPMNVAQD